MGLEEILEKWGIVVDESCVRVMQLNDPFFLGFLVGMLILVGIEFECKFFLEI